MPQEFSPKDQILKLLHYWWIVAVTMIVGGLLGYAIHHLRPPVYQAKASLYTFIDFLKITDVQLTPYDEDVTINTVQAVMLSNGVVGEVLTKANKRGISLDYDTFIHQMSIYRKLADYDLFFRDHDPLVAQQIVNDWAEIGLEKIRQLQTEGLLPLYLTVNLGNLAALPQTPTYSQTNSYVFSGALIGLVIGIILSSTPFLNKPKWLNNHNKRNKSGLVNAPKT
jgi:hypothetical protein